MSRFIDLTSQKFNKLTVIKRVDDHIQPSGRHKIRWLCKCDCGNEVIVHADSLKRDHTTSCGCINKEIHSKLATELFTKHDLSNTRLYNIWSDMKSRCYNLNNKRYKDYGARNIKVCDEWLNDFQNFYDWAMSTGYDENAKYGVCTIDRIDVNGNYEPCNCRWADMKTQSRNRRDNVNIIINGQTHCLKDWCEILNLNYKTVNSRIYRGLSPETALAKR